MLSKHIRALLAGHHPKVFHINVQNLYVCRV